MKKKNLYWIIGIIVFILILIIVLRGFSGEDDWIKDSRGVYIKHGNPSVTPLYVLEQQDALSCASDLYSQAISNGIEFNSQCLGVCRNYSVDIVHVSRTIEDDRPENQCSDYPKKTPYFIELNKNGEIVRVA